MIFNSAKKKFLDGDIDLATDTIKAALLDSNHLTDIDTQEFWSDLSDNEVSGSGYTAGGVTLSNKTVTKDDVNNKGIFDADDVSWAGSTITARYLVIYKDTGDNATSPLIAIVDFGSNQTSTNSDFIVQWNAEGILNVE